MATLLRLTHAIERLAGDGAGFLGSACSLSCLHHLAGFVSTIVARSVSAILKEKNIFNPALVFENQAFGLMRLKHQDDACKTEC